MAVGGGNRPRLLLVILLVTSLFLITLDLRGISITKTSRSATQSFLAPIQRGFSDVFSPVGNFIGEIKNFGKVNAENQELKAANAKLKSQLVIGKDIKGQLDKLKGTLNLAGRGGFKVVAARVIGQGSASTFSQTITIDAGASDGVTKDMTVIGDSGLVGVVKNTTASSAIVLLMSDPTFKIGVRIAGSQIVGVLSGNGTTRYTLQLLDPNGTIKENDVLLSLGSDNNRPFVPGIPVGYVKSVDNSNSALVKTAQVGSYSQLSSLGVVSVIVDAGKSDPRDALIPKPAPTATIWVTATGTPEASSSATPSPITSTKPLPVPKVSKK
jgi:rod shape-determining protein MreC